MPNPWIDFGDLDNPSDPFAQYAIESATYMLWALTGRKWNGIGQTTEQYVCPEFDIPSGCTWDSRGRFQTHGGFYAYLADAHVFGGGSRLRLRRQPVREIISVSSAGSPVASANYYLRNGAELVMRNGFGLCDGPEITYRYGVAPPALGKLAAIELANELVKNYNGQDCALPDRITSIDRQGLAIQVFDPGEFLNEGKIGLTLTDYFIMTTNPGRAHKPAKIFSPDMPRGYTTR